MKRSTEAATKAPHDTACGCPACRNRRRRAGQPEPSTYAVSKRGRARQQRVDTNQERARERLAARRLQDTPEPVPAVVSAAASELEQAPTVAPTTAPATSPLVGCVDHDACDLGPCRVKESRNPVATTSAPEPQLTSDDSKLPAGMRYFGKIPRPGASTVSAEHAWVSFVDYPDQPIQQMSARDFEKKWSVSVDKLTVSKPDRDPRTPGRKGPQSEAERFDFGEGGHLVFKNPPLFPDRNPFEGRVYLR